MQKKWMRMLAVCQLCFLLLTTTACAAPAALPDKPTEETPSVVPVRTGGMLYIPDRSVYFADVNTGYRWAFHAIDYLANTNVVTGTGNLIYSPAESLSRADFVLMLYRAYDMQKYSTEEKFSDVRENAYYAKAVDAARAIGIVSGGTKNDFRPTAKLTRQDAMVMLKRTLDRTGLAFKTGDLSKFTDAKRVSPYAAESVAALVDAGVISGTRKGKLNPREPVTRAEMAVMLYHALHLRAVEGTAVYLPQPAVRIVCVGSTIYADVRIENYRSGQTYAGLYQLEQMVQKDHEYSVTLGDAEPIDDTIVWDGNQLTVNGTVMPVADDHEAIAVDMYSKRKAGLCSTGKEYRAGAVSVIDGVVQTVYYKK